MQKALANFVSSSSLLVSLLIMIQASISQGAPSRRPFDTYDQRQDGKLNVHAKLDNFLIVVAPSWSAGSADLSELLKNGLLVSQQASELKGIASTLGGNRDNDEDKNSVAESRIDKVEEDERPPRRDVISNLQSSIVTMYDQVSTGSSKEMTREKDDDAIDKIGKNLPVNLETSEQLSEPSDDKNIPDDTFAESQTDEAADLNGGKLKKKAASRALNNFDDRSSMTKLPHGQKDGNWNVESKKIDWKHVNDVGDLVGEHEQTHELKLIGEGIENCGPERFRDRHGICRFRVTPAS